MSRAIENFIKAQEFAMTIRPNVGGFPYFAEALRRAGITCNAWNLPSCQSIYLSQYGSIATSGVPMVSSIIDIPSFNRAALNKSNKDGSDRKKLFS